MRELNRANQDVVYVDSIHVHLMKRDLGLPGAIPFELDAISPDLGIPGGFPPEMEME